MAAWEVCVNAKSTYQLLPLDRQVPNGGAEVDLAHCASLHFGEVLEESLRYEPTRQHRSALPGVQDKLSGEMISLPLRGRNRGAFYILKLSPPGYPRLVENEAFFLQMARACGIRTAHAELVHDADGRAGLLVTRFDRLTGKQAGVKVHQEDACQLLDRYPQDKYNLSLREIAQGLQVCTAPIVETLKLLRLYAFCYLIGNGDLHAKNISVWTLPGSGRVELTPAYDVLSTLPYGDQTAALMMDGRNTRFQLRDFVEFGTRHGAREAAVHSMLDALLRQAAPWLGRLDEVGLDAKKTNHLRRTLGKRSTELAG